MQYCILRFLPLCKKIKHSGNSSWHLESMMVLIPYRFLNDPHDLMQRAGVKTGAR